MRVSGAFQQQTSPGPPTWQFLIACALHRPVACRLAFSCDRSAARAASAIAHGAGHRVVATVKAATSWRLGRARAHCMKRWRQASTMQIFQQSAQTRVVYTLCDAAGLLVERCAEAHPV